MCGSVRRGSLMPKPTVAAACLWDAASLSPCGVAVNSLSVLLLAAVFPRCINKSYALTCCCSEHSAGEAHPGSGSFSSLLTFAGEEES